MNVANIKVSTRLNFGFGIITLGTLLVAAISIATVYKITSSVDYMVNQSFAKARLVTEWRDATKLNGTRLVLLQNGLNGALKDSIEQKMRETSGRISEIQKELNSMSKSASEQAQYQDISKKREKYLSARDTLLTMKKNQITENVSAAESALENALQVYLSSIDELGNIHNDDIKSIEGNIQKQLSENQITLGVLSSLIVMVSIFFGYLIKKSVINPLKKAILVTQNVSLGNMTLDFNTNGKNEISELLLGLKNMTENLAVIMQKVRSGTEIIVAKSGQMAVGSMELSSRTVEQASSLDETSSTMKSIMQTVRQNSEHANEANKLAIIASDVAIKGGIAVSEAVDMMGKINASSKKIADISSVIDGIAFQTNILALNAAVEAARAGEQGRGFAVVASEVRGLAQRCAAAAKEIKMLIEESVETVDMGEKQIHHTGATMEEIVVSIKKVSNIVEEIANASLEQSNGIEQIDIAISQLDRMTQQNANLVEESLSSIQSLEEQTAGLMAVVGN